MSNCLSDSESDYDDEPVRGKKLLSTFNLGTCSSNSDGSVQKRLTTLPIKRPFADNNNSFRTSVKKPKVYVRRLVDRPFSVRMRENIKREFDLVKFLTRNCERMKNVEELKLQSLERDVKERSSELLNKKKQVGCVRRISQYYTKMQSKIEKCVKDLEEKEAPVCLIEDLIKNYKHELKKNEIELRKVEDNNDKDGGRKRSSRLLRKKIDKSTKEIKTKEEAFVALKIFVSGKIEELQSEMRKLSKVMDKRDKRRTDQHDRMKDFESMKKQFEDRVTEPGSKEKQCDRRLKELDSNEKHFELQVKELELKQEKFEGRVKEIKSKEEAFEGRVKEFESKEEEFEVQVKELEIKKKHFESQVKELGLKEKLFERWVNEFESEKKDLKRQEKEQFEGRVMELKSKEEKFQGQVKELESKKKHLERQVNELNSKEKQLKSWVKEVESEKKHFESQVKELKSKEKQFEGRVKEIASKEQQLEDHVNAIELKEHEFKDKLKELELEKKHLESQVKDLKSKENQLEGRVKEIESKEVNFEDRVKELGTKMNDFESRVKELGTKQKFFESRVKELGSKLKQYEGRVKEFRSEEEEFKGQVREFKSKEKDFEGRVRKFESKEGEFELNRLELQLKELKSKENHFEGQLEELELRDNQYETLIKSFEEEIESEDHPSPAIDGRSLQLRPVEQTDELESRGNDILVNLLASSDPSKDVLDIIQNHIVTQCKGDNVVTIKGSHIVLLEQLMRISPHIKPHVQEEALKLVLNLKAYISENTENSVGVLGYLLLLSIYGLVPYFDEDEILKYFGSVAQHKIAVELFGMMGLTHKISDFVQNLIDNQQHVEAVRFICACNITNKNQSSVDLLWELVQWAKAISESNCKKTNSIEIKDKARDQEIASLETILRCVSDNNIESVDLLDQIQGRILELNKQKGKQRLNLEVGSSSKC